MKTTEQAWGSPQLPNAPTVSVDALPLSSTRDELTRMPGDVEIELAIRSVFDQWRVDPEKVDALYEIQEVLESVRARPRGDARLRGMNTIVRTLGQPQILATLLDIMRDSAGREGTRGQALAEGSQRASQHCIYGWCGQTGLVRSRAEVTPGTVEPQEGVREMFGEMPTSIWGISMHVWQPNPNAKGFPTGKPVPDVLREPPHSHPFDFASMVVTGTLHQSIYAQHDPLSPGDIEGRVAGRYDDVPLEHVDGVWPPHSHRAPCELAALEATVRLSAGESYFMPCGRIHDVEIDAETATSTPTITLFLASEMVAKPHVYMAPSMAAFHAAHPALKHEGRALPPADWHAKLRAVAAYLRGDAPVLCLDDIVRYDGEYAFFHA